jgi:hypothetical protein
LNPENQPKLIVNAQSAFQCSSTPLTLHVRYMVWNSVGLITQSNIKGDESINIEFHNTTFHHTIHIKNEFGYTMADMSKEAIIMASPGKITNETEINSTFSGSMLACILINSCYNNKEWKIAMLQNEYIKCICVSKALIGCMTSRRFLRIYGLAGTQKEIICFNYLPICMRAHENTIFICYSTDIKSTFINYSLYHIDDHIEINKKQEAEHGILPLTENAKLEWIGFSDEGNTFYSDSNGYLYTKCITISKSEVWMPYYNLKIMLKYKLDNYWIIGISECNQTIKSILCHAANYPETIPRPTVSMISINMPSCEPCTQKIKLEKDYCQNKITILSTTNGDCSTQNFHLNLDQNELYEIVDKYEDSSKEVLMKLFMSSCKNNSEQRAYEVASIMDSASLKLAIKYANKTRALILTQNLILLAEKRAIIKNNQKCKQNEGNTKIKILFNILTISLFYVVDLNNNSIKIANANDNNIISINDLITNNNNNRFNYNIITINCGGTIFQTKLQMLNKKISVPNSNDYYPDNLFQKIVSQSANLILIHKNEIFIDRDPILFNYIIRYLRTEHYFALDFHCSDQEKFLLIEEAEFFELNGLKHILKDSISKSHLNFKFIESSILTFNQFNYLYNNLKFKDKKFKLIYTGSHNSFDSSVFHQKCDKINETFIIIKSKNDNIFGGYIKGDWDCDQDYFRNNTYGECKDAFIFSLINIDNMPITLKCINKATAYYKSNKKLCCFGLSDLAIYHQAHKNLLSTSNLGWNYEHPKYKRGSLEAQSFLAGSNNFKIKELEVYSLQ